MKSRPATIIKRYLPYLLSAVALTVFVGYLIQNASRYRRLFSLSGDSVLALVGLVLGLAACNGLINLFFYRIFDIKMTLNESIGLASINTLANQLPFAGGLIAKAMYLKQRYELAYTCFVSATSALYVCFVAANGAIGLTLLFGWWLTGLTAVPPLLALGFLLMTVSLVSLWLPINVISMPGRLGRRLDQLAEGWLMLGRHVRLAGILMVLQMSTTLIFASRLRIAFHALSQDVTLAQCLLFAAATILTRLVNITPGGLGVREGLVAGVASLMGLDPGVSAVAVGLDRLVATAVIVGLGTVYSYVLGKKASESSRSELEQGSAS